MIRLSQDDGAYHLTLDQPASGNSLSRDMIEACHDALDQAEGGGAKLLVVRGEGRHFCTGFNLQDLELESDGDLLLRMVRIEQLLARIWAAPFLTIAVGQGSVFGAGADLFVACRRRVALNGARFCFPGAGFGLVLGTRRLAARVGADVATGWVASGCRIDAAEAEAAGLVTDRCEESAVDMLLDQEMVAAARLDAWTLAAIRSAARADDQLDRDLAALVRSAARPGLKSRIAGFAARNGIRPGPAR